MIKYGITREFLKITECYSTLICIELWHTSCPPLPPNISIYAKDTASEVDSVWVQNIHKRKKSVFSGSKCYFIAHESVYLGTLT